MELRHLRYFMAVAEDLNFRRAAARLHVAQPALSAQIKSLESDLGVRLLERTTRSVSLTAAGRLFLEEARALLVAAEQARQRARRADQGIEGLLRLGVIAPAANSRTAAVLREFRTRFPGVQLSLFDLTSPAQLERIRSGELDAGLLRPPVGFPELDSVVVEKSRQVLALPTGHRLARKRSIEWSDFDREDLVLVHPSQQHGYYDAFLAACARAGAKPQPAQYANDIQTKLWLISAGFGIAPTTETVAQIRRPGLCFRPLPGGLPPVITVLVWKRDGSHPALDHLRQALTG